MMPQFFQIMLTVFLAEMGDKTQLMMIAMAARYKLHHIFLGAALAIAALNALAVGVGSLVSSLVPAWAIKLAAGLAFFYFAWSSFLAEEDEEEEKTKKTGSSPVLAVFGSFFLAELGDKTQLSAITFAANAGASRALLVWGACSIGLLAADVLGVLLGYLLKSRAPEGLMNLLAFALFTVFGILTLREGLGLLLGATGLVWGITVGAALLFALLCLVTRTKMEKNR
jgi:putative Ca2+/H+ antiporter (TMEM165/GDT1 family)